MPRLEIDLFKVQENARFLVDHFATKGVSVTGVTKVVLGEPSVARAMLRAGVTSIGDSRIENIQRMREAKVDSTFALLRTPLPSQIELAVEYADVSFNTELAIIKRLDQVARLKGKTHQIVLMVELGDLREGILPQDLEETVRSILPLMGIRILGVGANLACFAGVPPDNQRMEQLTNLVRAVEKRFDLKLEMVSGGNSANYQWFSSCADIGAVNNLRLGESILLGCDPLNRLPIPGLHTDAVTVVAEVIESKLKASFTTGDRCETAFGPREDIGARPQSRRAILGVGRQDVAISGLTVLSAGLEILGGSSDHLILDCGIHPVEVGDEVRFRPNYAALLAAMTSPHVQKVMLEGAVRHDQVDRWSDGNVTRGAAV